jgi:predicted  nucleic acid-binding Zn-ribbon protein
MSNLAKVFIVLNFVLSIFFLASAGVLLAKTDEWRAKDEAELQAHQKDVAELNAAKSQLNQQLTTVTGDRENLKANLGEVTTARDKFQGDWTSEQKTNAELRKSVEETSQTLKTIQQSLASAQEQISGMQKGKEEAEQKMREAVEKQRVAEAEVTRLKAESEDKTGQVAKLTEQITGLTTDLDKANTKIQMAVDAGVNPDMLIGQPAINGKVVEVDPKAGVVVLSVGRQANVEKGFTFHVYRGNEYLGMVRVDAVYPDLSAASVLKLAPGKDIQKLDDVATRL